MSMGSTSSNQPDDQADEQDTTETRADEHLFVPLHRVVLVMRERVPNPMAGVP